MVPSKASGNSPSAGSSVNHDSIMCEVDINFLQSYADAWNAHDIDTLMNCMTEDCIFETGGGSDSWGTRFTGQADVRQRFESVWQDVPDAKWSECKHFIAGDRGLSEWLFTGTAPDGTVIAIQGCDVFTFRDGMILIKSTYLKQKQ